MQNDLISRSLLLEEIKSVRVTVTGLRAGKGILAEYANQYKDTLLRVIKEQPTAYNIDVVVESIEKLPQQDFLGVAHIPRTAALNMVKRNGNCELPENPSIDRLSGDYIRGYTRAIQDVKQIVIGIYENLRHFRIKWSEKIIKELFTCILEHRDKLREQRNGFIRWNVVLNKFEWFEREEE